MYSEISPGRAFPVRVALGGDGSELDVHEQFTGPLVAARPRLVAENTEPRGRG